MVLLESMQIPLGSRAIDFSLKGTDDKIYTLDNFKDNVIIVIIFMCNHCPYVQAIWNRLVILDEEFKSKGVQFIGINPNSANPDYPEDNFDNMKKYAEKYNMKFPYLCDENQEIAQKYKAQCTPDIYVYDKKRLLAYHGRIDDNWQDEKSVNQRSLRDAIQILLEGQMPDDNQYPTIGCSIKWIN